MSLDHSSLFSALIKYDQIDAWSFRLSFFFGARFELFCFSPAAWSYALVTRTVCTSPYFHVFFVSFLGACGSAGNAIPEILREQWPARSRHRQG